MTDCAIITQEIVPEIVEKVVESNNAMIAVAEISSETTSTSQAAAGGGIGAIGVIGLAALFVLVSPSNLVSNEQLWAENSYDVDPRDVHLGGESMQRYERVKNSVGSPNLVQWANLDPPKVIRKGYRFYFVVMKKP